MSIISDLATRLQTTGVGTIWDGSTGTIVRGRRIDAPGDTILAIQSYGGDESRLFDGSEQPADARLNAQIVARASTQTAAETLAGTAYENVTGRHVTINGRSYAWIAAVQQPAFIGVDERDRPLIAFNVQARRHNL